MHKAKISYEEKLSSYKNKLKESINKLREFMDHVYKPLMQEIELKEIITKRQNTEL